MGVWIDVAIVVIVLIYAAVGLYKGFVDSLLKMIGSVGALLLAIFGAKPVLNFLDNIFHFRAELGSVCVNAFAGSVDPEIMDMVLNEANVQTIKNSLEADGLNIPERLMMSILNNANLDAGLTFREVLNDSFGTILGCIIVGVVLFILVKFIVFLLAKLFDSKESRALSGTNRALGFIFGALKGCVFVVVVYTVLAVTCMITPIQPQLDEIKNGTSIFKGTYDPYSQIVQEFVDDKMGEFVENLSNNMLEDSK